MVWARPQAQLTCFLMNGQQDCPNYVLFAPKHRAMDAFDERQLTLIEGSIAAIRRALQPRHWLHTQMKLWFLCDLCHQRAPCGPYQASLWTSPKVGRSVVGRAD